MIYERYVVVVGKGESDQSELNAFDAALEDAGIGKFNLRKVSSILSCYAKELEKESLATIEPGTELSCVLSKCVGYKQQRVASALSWGTDPSNYGLVFEASLCSSNKSLDELASEAEAEAKKRLLEGAAMRKFKLEGIKSKSVALEVKRNYGCTVAALVYLP